MILKSQTLRSFLVHRRHHVVLAIFPIPIHTVANITIIIQLLDDKAIENTVAS